MILEPTTHKYITTILNHLMKLKLLTNLQKFCNDKWIYCFQYPQQSSARK